MNAQFRASVFSSRKLTRAQRQRGPSICPADTDTFLRSKMPDSPFLHYQQAIERKCQSPRRGRVASRYLYADINTALYSTAWAVVFYSNASEWNYRRFDKRPRFVVTEGKFTRCSCRWRKSQQRAAISLIGRVGLESAAFVWTGGLWRRGLLEGCVTRSGKLCFLKWLVIFRRASAVFV